MRDDREVFGQPPAQSDTAQPANSPGSGPVAAVAQRVVLYEEDPADPQGKRYVGSAIWRTETISPGPGKPELAIRADVEIPDRTLAMTLALRRNTYQALPASHTIEITFKLPADFPVRRNFQRARHPDEAGRADARRSACGLAAKVTNGFFLIGLSARETDKDRNIQMLKDRAWLDIPLVYNNGRRAILAVEKGTPASAPSRKRSRRGSSEEAATNIETWARMNDSQE